MEQNKLETDPSDLLIKAAKLLPYAKRARTLQGFATAYTYEPEGESAFGVGHLLAAVEVLSTTKQAEEVVDLIIKSLGESFYNVAPSDQTDIYTRFAAAVKTVNQELASYAEHGKAGWIGRLSAVLAVQCGSELHLTHAGSASAYLYRSGTSNLVTPQTNEHGPSRPGNSFSSIASGHLQTHDRLLLATPALYHQIDKITLHQIIKESSPEIAIEKLSAIVNQTPDASRVAAIVAELTTAEQLASQRGAQPLEVLEVKVGRPDTLIETARQNAAPLVAGSVKSAKALARLSLEHSKKHLLPRLRLIILGLVQATRKVILHKKYRNILAALCLLILLVTGLLVYRNFNSRTLNDLVARYDTAFAGVQAAKAQASIGDKEAAKQKLDQAGHELESLKNLPQAPLLANRLSTRTHPESDPASISGLQAKIKQLLDQIEGITSVAPEELLNLSEVNGQAPSHLEVIGTKVILVSSTDGSIYTYNSQTRQLQTAALKPTGVGKVIATSLSTNNDGVYLLTDAASIWFYKHDGSTLTQQTTSFGNWPKGSDISNYAGNLYILASDNSQIYKHLRTIGGFSGKSNYLLDPPSNLAESKAMAIDGNIYTVGPYGLRRFLAGKLDRTLPLPGPLKSANEVYSFADGNRLLVFDQHSNRLGVIATDDTNLNLIQQLNLTGNLKLVDVRADQKGQTMFALTDTKLIKFALPQ